MTVVEQLEAAQKDLAELKASAEAQGKELATLKAQADEQGKASVEIVLKAQAELADAKKALEAEQAAHAVSKAELDKAKNALSNPAFAAAAVAGQDKPTAEGGAEVVAVKTYGDLMAEYKAISDPVNRAIWRKEHAKELGL